jgi:hypothetical protein
MNDEERQRQMDFILNQQAKFEANIGRLGDDHERSVRDHERAIKRIDRLERVVKLAIRAGARERKEFRERINALVDAQMKTEAAHAETEAAVTRVEAAHAKTEAALALLAVYQVHGEKRLDALIDMIMKNRNGKDRKE